MLRPDASFEIGAMTVANTVVCGRISLLLLYFISNTSFLENMEGVMTTRTLPSLVSIATYPNPAILLDETLKRCNSRSFSILERRIGMSISSVEEYSSLVEPTSAERQSKYSI